MQNLYIFNPNHDLALANGSPSYMSPESARRFANDLAFLPAWYADRDDVLVPKNFYWRPPIELAARYVTTDKVYERTYHNIIPWGWNEALCKQLVDLGIDQTLMYSTEQLQAIRLLAHRNLARKAMLFLAQKHPDRILPQPAELLEDIPSVENFMHRNPKAVFKAPWSGSGKGIFFAEKPLSDSLIGWCRRTIFKQGGVMGEAALDKVQDFAMEFLIEKNKVSFAGYSLFMSESTGIYRGNELLSNEEIERRLSQWIDITQLDDYKNDYIQFLTQWVQPHYQGYIGIDMLVYKEENSFLANPAVEINMRMTMGMVSRIIYDQYVDYGRKGWFFIDHMPQGLLEDHHRQINELPFTMNGNKITGGYLSLCPIEKSTNYRARIVITDKD